MKEIVSSSGLDIERNERNPFLSLPGFVHIGSLG